MAGGRTSDAWYRRGQVEQEASKSWGCAWLRQTRETVDGGSREGDGNDAEDGYRRPARACARYALIRASGIYVTACVRAKSTRGAGQDVTGLGNQHRDTVA